MLLQKIRIWICRQRYYQQLGEDITDILFTGKSDVISTLFRNCEREHLHR